VLKKNCTTKTHGIQGSEQQDEGRAYASPRIANSQSEAIIDHQDDPQDVDLKRGASADSERGAIDDPQDTNLLERGLINDPQDVGLGREEQVDPQPIPAPSLQDIDGDDKHEQRSHSDYNAETQIQIPGPEVPADWQPPTLLYITCELRNDVDTSSMGYAVWRPSNPSGYNPPVFDDDGLLVEENSNNEGQTPQQVSQQGDLEEGTIEDDGKIPALVPIGEGNSENDDRMPRLIRDPRRDPLDQNPYAALADDSNDEVPDVDASHLNNPNGTEDKETRTYASVASSSSGSGDADDQPVPS